MSVFVPPEWQYSSHSRPDCTKPVDEAGFHLGSAPDEASKDQARGNKDDGAQRMLLLLHQVVGEGATPRTARRPLCRRSVAKATKELVRVLAPTGF
ncbi:hypothetical protein RJ55_06915 [Drechmeria coniospora]|nr:hypothetical protein RJ55_06915 [Drechmeria coniospora]